MLRALYHAAWALVVVRLGAQVNRWYLGLTWFRIAPRLPHALVLGMGVVVFVGVLVVCLRRAYLAHPPESHPI